MSVPGRPRALLVMDESSFRAHFDRERLDRLAGMVALGDPVRIDELDSPTAQEKLKNVDILVTSWGAPQPTQPKDASPEATGPFAEILLRLFGTF